jgi:hypothetical protein
MNLTAIRDAANELTSAAKYVERGCPTGSAVIENMRDRILRALDEAERDTCQAIDNVELVGVPGQDGIYQGVTHKTITRCSKCHSKMQHGSNFCPGCGRKIERGSKG